MEEPCGRLYEWRTMAGEEKEALCSNNDRLTKRTWKNFIIYRNRNSNTDRSWFKRRFEVRWKRSTKILFSMTLLNTDAQ